MSDPVYMERNVRISPLFLTNVTVVDVQHTV